MTDLSFLNDIEFLLRQPWFHGHISSSDAEKKLATAKKGTFLFRFSSSDPGCFAISTVSNVGTIKHFRIFHRPGMSYILGKSECQSLSDIIIKYKRELSLKTPCPGSPYQHLFGPQATS